MDSMWDGGREDEAGAKASIGCEESPALHHTPCCGVLGLSVLCNEKEVLYEVVVF